MSVHVIGRVQADPEVVAKLWEERPDDFKAVAADAKAKGAISHQWGFGDGVVWVIDVWPDADSFQNFFASQTMIPQLMAAAGVTEPPMFEISEARTAPDTF